jgi:hypothetical protein
VTDEIDHVAFADESLQLVFESDSRFLSFECAIGAGPLERFYSGSNLKVAKASY